MENCKKQTRIEAPWSDLSNLPTSVKPERLEFWLNGYDQTKYKQLHDGFTLGFNIGYEGNLQPVQIYNLKSSSEHPEAIKKKIEKELSLGRIEGPFTQKPFQEFRTSPIGVVEKKVLGTYRMIHHLSYPEGNSINDGIPTEKSCVHYQTIDDAIIIIKSLGHGCWLAKTDIAEAFRIIPIHPAQYHLLGFFWEDHYYFDKCLPMGCSSSCQIFELVSTALHWMANEKLGVDHMVHVLDDFLIADANYDSCENKLNKFVEACLDMGIPIAPEKTVFPSNIMAFLGS